MNFIKKILKKFSKQNKNIVNDVTIEDIDNKSEFEIDSKLLDEYNFDNLCRQCKLNNKCTSGEKPCELFYNSKGEYNFIIVDDNLGVVESIKDIINDFKKSGDISDKWTIHYYYTKQAPIYLLKDIKRRNLIPHAGLIDITYGSILRIKEKNVKLNGVHIVDFILKVNPKFQFYFYTGNTLNPYIKPIKMMMDFFKIIHRDNMNNYIISKNFQDEDEIREKIRKLLKDAEEVYNEN